MGIRKEYHITIHNRSVTLKSATCSSFCSKVWKGEMDLVVQLSHPPVKIDQSKRARDKILLSLSRPPPPESVFFEKNPCKQIYTIPLFPLTNPRSQAFANFTKRLYRCRNHLITGFSQNTTFLAVIAKYGRTVSQRILFHQALLQKIALWIGIRTNDWTTETAIIAILFLVVF